MTSATVERVFEVDAPLEEAWQRLAEVERWPEWAPHITSVTVSPPGELGPTSSGALQIKRLELDQPFQPCRCRARRLEPMVVVDADPRQPADPLPPHRRLPDRHAEGVAPSRLICKAPLDVGPSSPGGDTVTELI